MKANIEGITLAISRKEGIELRNQIIKLMGGDTMPIHAGELRGTALAHFLELLSGNFDETRPGVNFIRSGS